MLTPEQIENYRQRLIDMRHGLLSDIARAQGNGRVAAEDFETQDVGDKALSVYTKEYAFQQSDQEYHELSLVDEAIERIDRGTFGVCQECGEPVEERRLEALPWTKFCVECQERAEAGEL